jgi:hypothetical protein
VVSEVLPVFLWLGLWVDRIYFLFSKPVISTCLFIGFFLFFPCAVSSRRSIYNLSLTHHVTTECGRQSAKTLCRSLVDFLKHLVMFVS